MMNIHKELPLSFPGLSTLPGPLTPFYTNIATLPPSLVKALINIVSIFPLGSLVQLNNRTVGRVIGAKPAAACKAVDRGFVGFSGKVAEGASHGRSDRRNRCCTLLIRRSARTALLSAAHADEAAAVLRRLMLAIGTPKKVGVTDPGTSSQNPLRSILWPARIG